MSGQRHNEGKARFALISPHAMRLLAEVLTFGARKYNAHNWTKGLSWEETIDSLERHIADFKAGKDIDAESKLPAIAHVLCNAMFLAHFYSTATGTDDRGYVRRFPAVCSHGHTLDDQTLIVFTRKGRRGLMFDCATCKSRRRKKAAAKSGEKRATVDGVGFRYTRSNAVRDIELRKSK